MFDYNFHDDFLYQLIPAFYEKITTLRIENMLFTSRIITRNKFIKYNV
jgi:hypothetical protein